MSEKGTPRMCPTSALRIIHARRGDSIVVTTMGPARDWMALGSPHPYDLVYVPSSMGQATSVGLGLALAQPKRRVIVCNGDGSQLMNLGSLVTISSQSPPNLMIVLFDNGVYEVTGSQNTPGSKAINPAGALDYQAIAESCGIKNCCSFERLSEWESGFGQLLRATNPQRCEAEGSDTNEGPAFCVLSVDRVKGNVTPRSPSPAPARAKSLRDALMR